MRAWLLAWLMLVAGPPAMQAAELRPAEILPVSEHWPGHTHIDARTDVVDILKGHGETEPLRITAPTHLPLHPGFVDTERGRASTTGAWPSW